MPLTNLLEAGGKTTSSAGVRAHGVDPQYWPLRSQLSQKLRCAICGGIINHHHDIEANLPATIQAVLQRGQTVEGHHNSDDRSTRYSH